MSSVTGRAQRMGHQAHNSDWLDKAARIGLVAFGVVHLMIAWLALQLAFGHNSGNASSQGAIQKLAHEPFGSVLVWLIALGLLALAAWQALEAALGHRQDDGADRLRKRAASGAKAVVYAGLAVSAIKAATGESHSSQSNKDGTDSATAKLMDQPFGQVLVALVGAAIVGMGGYLVYKAWTEKFVKELTGEGRSGDSGTAYVWFGKIGYTAKGVAFGVVGVLFLYAAISHDPHKSGGLDQALHKVLGQPFGPILLGIIAVGIGCFGLFCFARARHFNGD